MREAVLHLSGYQYQGIYGVNYRVKEKITMADLSFRVQHVIKNEIDVTQAQLSRNGIDVLHGDGQSSSTRTTIECRERRAARSSCRPSVHHRHRHAARGVPARSPSTAARSSTAIRFWSWPNSPRRSSSSAAA